MEQANKTGGRGGARAGAGRPPKAPAVDPVEITSDMVLNLLREVAVGQKKVRPEQLRAAMAVLSFEAKVPPGRPPGSGAPAGRPPGKKEERQQAAAGASSGAFATARPPAHMRQSDDD